MKKNITAIVVTWNSRKLIADLAGTIKGIEPLCNIVISDNASSDDTVKAAAEAIPGAKIIRNGRNPQVKLKLYAMGNTSRASLRS